MDMEPPRLHLACDPLFYITHTVNVGGDPHEGDLHGKCPGEINPGESCECHCHGAPYWEMQRALNRTA